MMLGCDAPAIFILGRVVRDRTIHARDFDADLTPFGADTFPSPSQSLTSFLAAPYTECRSFTKNQIRQLASIFRFAQHGEQRPRTVLLHLYRHAENIERAFFE